MSGTVHAASRDGEPVRNIVWPIARVVLTACSQTVHSHAKKGSCVQSFVPFQAMSSHCALRNQSMACCSKKPHRNRRQQQLRATSRRHTGRQREQRSGKLLRWQLQTHLFDVGQKVVHSRRALAEIRHATGNAAHKQTFQAPAAALRRATQHQNRASEPRAPEGHEVVR